MLISERAKKSLESNLCLYYLGGERRASDILSEQKKSILNEQQYHNLKKIVSLADQTRNTLYEENMLEFGRMLDRGWAIKKQLASAISNHTIDDMYQKAKACGAIGGKVLGAGGNGFLLLYAENHALVRKALNCKVLPFNIDREGTKVTFYE